MERSTQYGAATSATKDASIQGKTGRFYSCGPLLIIHVALFYVYAAFGGGAVVSKLGIHGGSPLVFELVRELVSAPLLFAAALLKGASMIAHREDYIWVLMSGICLFINQLCFFVGLKLADPITGSAWQSSIPVFTAAFAILAGFERLSLPKGVGISLATVATLFMALGSPMENALPDAVQNGLERPHSALAGHACFCLCSVGTSAYIVLSKKLVAKYQAISVSAWAFTISSVGMAFAALVINAFEPLTRVICNDVDRQIMENCIEDPWALPNSAFLPLAYEVVNNTLIAWYLMSWANQYAKATVTSIYTVVQPISAVVISACLISVKGTDWGSRYGFRLASAHDGIAIVVIFVSLVVMFSEGTLQTGKRLNLQQQKQPLAA